MAAIFTSYCYKIQGGAIWHDKLAVTRDSRLVPCDMTWHTNTLIFVLSHSVTYYSFLLKMCTFCDSSPSKYAHTRLSCMLFRLRLIRYVQKNYTGVPVETIYEENVTRYMTISKFLLFHGTWRDKNYIKNSAFSRVTCDMTRQLR